MKNEKVNKAVSLLVDNIFWFVGCALYACAVNFFNVPNNIAQGGFSGLAIVINYLTDLPVGAVNFALNIPVLILAWIFIGKKFVVKTLWVTAMLSALIDLVAAYVPYHYTSWRQFSAVRFLAQALQLLPPVALQQAVQMYLASCSDYPSPTFPTASL